MVLKNLELFDNFLDSLYIKKKTDRNKIIAIYKRLYKKGKNILDFENELEKLNWDEITINNITNYVINWNYRNKENIRLNEINKSDSK